MGRFRYAGDIEAIVGRWFDVPDEVKAPQARRYIESLYEAEICESEMELEAATEADWEDAPREEEASPGELDSLREELAQLHQRLEQPDINKAVDTIAGTVRAQQSSWDISKELAELEKRALASTATNKHLADTAEVFHREAEQERKKITNLTKANQKIMNEAFTSYSKSLNDLRKQKTELEYELGEMKTELKNNRKDMAKLRKILADWEAKQ